MKSESKTVPGTVKTVTISIEEYEALQELKAENARLNQQVQWLLEGMKLSRRKLFGASSEKSSASEQLSFLFNEAEVYEDQAAATEEETVPVSAHERRRRSGSVKDVLPENVPVEIVEHRIPEEERIIARCSALPGHIADDVVRFGEQVAADLPGKNRVVLKDNQAVLNGIGSAALVRLFQCVTDGGAHLLHGFIRQLLLPGVA